MFDINDFTKTYKGTLIFTESKYFDKFLESIENNKLMEHIKFCNDTLQLPPIYVFVKYYKNFFNTLLTRNEKIGLGACFGYYFQYILNEKYKAKSVWVGEKITGIKNASYFEKGN